MKRSIIILVIVALAIAGWSVRSKNASYARSQASQLATASAGAATTTKLNNLKQYVMNHSGSSVTVVMQAAFDQAAQAAQAAAVPPPSSSTLYAEAQAACAGHAVATVQAQCNQDYIQAHSTPAVTPSVPMPVASDYTYHFIAPAFTLDAPTALWGLAFLALVWLVLPALRPKPYF